jgi:hypothetical protein
MRHAEAGRLRAAAAGNSCDHTCFYVQSAIEPTVLERDRDSLWRATIMLAGVAAKVLAGDEESKAA